MLAIQVFGDPSAAGPRRIVSLAPSAASADSAPVMSFGEAAAEGEMQAFGLDELPSYYEGAEGMDVGADGQLHVAVVESDGPTPGARPGSALPRAPLAGLTEPSPNGLLPIVATNDSYTTPIG